MESSEKVLFITGGARRIGAAMVRYFHQQGYHVLLSYRDSIEQAKTLTTELNEIRPHSAKAIMMDFDKPYTYENKLQEALSPWGRLDVFIHNASRFFPTPLSGVVQQHWDSLMNSNAKAPLLLAQQAAPWLEKSHGCIINIADIHGITPLKNHTIYSMAKAALIMLTKSLARELAPEVRVNAIAPGPILWPEKENALDNTQQAKLINKTCLKKQGHPQQIAQAAFFFAEHAPYTTGDVLRIDGGRQLNSST